MMHYLVPIVDRTCNIKRFKQDFGYFDELIMPALMQQTDIDYITETDIGNYPDHPASLEETIQTIEQWEGLSYGIIQKHIMDAKMHLYDYNRLYQQTQSDLKSRQQLKQQYLDTLNQLKDQDRDLSVMFFDMHD